MKIKITCPRCSSNNVSIVENPEGKVPLYKCSNCGYKDRIFPKFETDKDDE